VGYDESWRWRMAGGPGSEAAHREWWTRAVGSVAYAPVRAVLRTATGDAAPLARLIDDMGPAAAAPPASRSATSPDARVLLAAILLLLVAEWASRRLRGAR
jgi:hypothetical protein